MSKKNTKTIRTESFSRINDLLDDNPYEKKIIKKITAANKHVTYERPEGCKPDDKMLRVVANFMISLRHKGTNDIIYQPDDMKANPNVIENGYITVYDDFDKSRADIIKFEIFRVLLSLKFIKVSKIKELSKERKRITIKLSKLGLDYVNQTFPKDKQIKTHKTNDDYTTDNTVSKYFSHLVKDFMLIAIFYAFSIISFSYGIFSDYSSFGRISLGIIGLITVILGLIIHSHFKKYDYAYHKAKKKVHKRVANYNQNIDKLRKNSTRGNFLKFLKQHDIKEPNQRFSYDKHLKPIDEFIFNSSYCSCGCGESDCNCGG